EDYIVNKLKEKNWQFVKADDLERESYDEPLLIPNLVRAIKRINYNIPIDDEEIKQILNELRLKHTGLEGIKAILNYYKFGVPIKLTKEHIVARVQLFDYENIENNEFLVSRQVFYYKSTIDKIRVDIILYVNGIPLVNIECKDPISFSLSWRDAYEQIKNYEQKVPELYKYVQIGVAVADSVRYFPIVPWQKNIDISEWKDEQKDPVDAMIEMLTPNILLDIIKNFIFVKVQFGESNKVIARYMQFRAVNKIYNRVINNLEGKENKNKGLIWHWQGSGKTLEMIFAANKLFYNKKLENPTIFFVVDRDDLEDQLYQDFCSLDITKPEKPIASIRELEEVIKHDDYQGRRGIFFVLIHKFRPEELRDLQEEINRRKKSIRDRKNVIVFIDEGHRSQYGILAAQMRSLLKSAFFFCFTGTPISKREKDTYHEFSYAPEEYYLDRYFILDSIRDGFTLKIVYQPRLEKLHLDKEKLDAFLESEFEDLDDGLRAELQEEIKEKLNSIKVILENPTVIDKKAQDIALHFNANLNGKFKAMVVAASRRACVLYKKALDQYLPKEYSEVVMTFLNEEKDDDIKAYLDDLKNRPEFRSKDLDEIREEIRENFRNEELPKILIVTDMLITGFNAPILQTIYLDKPLKEHRLLQTIARTNRPYKDVKEAGLIIDYIGILNELEKAFKMYNKDDIVGAIYYLDTLKEEFECLIMKLLEILKNVPRNITRENLLNAIIAITSNEHTEREFVYNYKKLRRIFEQLGPNEIKVERYKDYQWISYIYTAYLKEISKSDELKEKNTQRHFDKTIQIIHNAIDLENFEILPKIDLDENFLKKLDKESKSIEEKAVSLVFNLRRWVLVERHQNPICDSLVDWVEELIRLYHEKIKDYKKIYSQGKEILERRNRLAERQKELGFSTMEYAMLLIKEKKLGPKPELVDDVRNLSAKIKSFQYPGWIYQKTAIKQIEREVRKFIRKYRRQYNLKTEEIEEIYENLINAIKKYGK
ncbi:MAG: HsdR family type I site-specific deoxyribonuclease, partial [candidate division WOR-3 bacterium]|nr:HsdR family type I site-specific deoxyribonuclease [candidate division WOR-3 bacterium]